MEMYQVVKRDGKTAEFSIQKIAKAITKAFEAVERKYHSSVIDLLALKVTADFEPKIKDGYIAVEDIQDSVETVLSQAGYADVAKAYILYRRQREKLRNMQSTLLDYKKVAGEGEFHRYLFGGRFDPVQFRGHYRQLLAVGDL